MTLSYVFAYRERYVGMEYSTLEAFAKFEVTVWQGYCLGAGIGSKAAASNLSKRSVNWFSNFFKTGRQSYTNAGGNGAAMRIQPHVWSAQGNVADVLSRVLRDALVTHGHPHGFCGAVFHAMCLWSAIRSRKIPTLDEARKFIDNLPSIAELVKNDSELSSFWLPTWEHETGTNLSDALQQFCNEANRDVDQVEVLFQDDNSVNYHKILAELGCLTERFRGSGFKTSFAALILSQLFQDDNVEHALIKAANELESDTDTIATMAGALLGAIAKKGPSWAIQDRSYIESEALRLARIAFSQVQRSFRYPDISEWSPPSSQSDSIVLFDGALSLAGFGPVSPKSKPYESRDSVWQWFELSNSQTILAKRRLNSVPKVSSNQFPSDRQRQDEVGNKQKNSGALQEGLDLDLRGTNDNTPSIKRTQRSVADGRSFHNLDAATSEIISSGFDNATLGRLINQCIDQTESIETTVSLSAIVAKAKIARRRRK